MYLATRGEWGGPSLVSMDLGPDDVVSVTAPLAPYKQLTAILRAQIERGDYEPEVDRLPSERDLSQIHGLARMTVRRSLGILVQEGLIHSAPGRGMYVTKKETGPHP